MKQVLMLVVLAIGLVSSTGCHWLHHRHCNHCQGPIGCRPCQVGWQRGGTDYQRYLGCNHCGGHCGGQCGKGHGGLHGHGQAYAQSQPAGAGQASGAPVAQVAYPYYTTRGPRDFFLDNPPTIGR